jgi:transcriptional regulator with AAA-type ATPase domain/transcriptional regulatory protein LevR
MNKELKIIIGGENKKNPLTDDQIAEKMGLSREKITLMRKENNIPTSKDRMKPYLRREIKEILAADKNISVRKLTKKIQKRDFNVSRYLVRQIFDEIVLAESDDDLFNNSVSENSLEDKLRNKVFEKDDSFAEMIGYDLSLKAQVQQAKAAVLYPPFGLHTLIIGESGVGKSFLAEQMYKFALNKNKIEPDKFVVFNCADYAENPQLLYSHLFGHKKGSFTGADKEKEGLVQKADKGILFLDEVHRLSSEGQEMLFNIIDHGFYRKLGESNKQEKVNLMIIAATTEDIKSNLLATFRRRIPLIIDLPPLSKRTLEEKWGFIKLFISRESRQINKDIKVKYEAARALLSFSPENNVGQLESKIKEICARAYLEFISNKKENVEISLDFLDLKIKRGFFEESVKREDIKKIVKDDLVLTAAKKSSKKLSNFNPKYKLENDIYRYLEEKNKELYSLGFSKKEINNKLNELLAEKVKSVFNRVEDSLFDNQNILNEIVGPNILEMVNDILVIVHRELPEFVLSQRLKYALAIHLDAVVERIKSGKIIKHPALAEIKRTNNKLYKIAEKIVNYLNEEYLLQIPEDETGYISMYLSSVNKQKINKSKAARPGIIVLSHGGVASEMLKVANWLLGGSELKAIDMNLKESPNTVLNKLIDVAEQLDRGRGILLLVDMGSLKSFGEIITEKTGIKTRVISRVDTVMLMEAVRWSKFDNLDLDELTQRILKSKNNYTREKKREAILIYCITGKGGALRIKDYLEHRITGIEDNYQIITTGIFDKDINNYIESLSSKYELKAVIGNMKAERKAEIYHSFKNILSENGFNNFIQDLNIDNKKLKKINSRRLLDKNLIYFNLDLKSKEEVLKFLSDSLLTAGVVKESYYKAVEEKEKWGITYVGDGIAIPHADSKHVNYSQFALAILKEPIDWSGYEVKIVCMFAFKDLETEYFSRFYNKLKTNINKVKSSKNIEMLKEVLIDE